MITNIQTATDYIYENIKNLDNIGAFEDKEYLYDTLEDIIVERIPMLCSDQEKTFLENSNVEDRSDDFFAKHIADYVTIVEALSSKFLLEFMAIRQLPTEEIAKMAE